MVRIAIVTDSTSCLPDAVIKLWGIHVVPVQVIVAGHGYDEGVEITPGRVAAAMRDKVSVSTSRPAPARFADVYNRIAEAGADVIVSAHMSSELSGTYDAAALAAERACVPTTVVDTRSIVMGLGFSVTAGAELARRGAQAKDVARRIQTVAGDSRVLFYVDSLEYLRRGGRIGSAGRWIGQALAMKPILHLADGRVQPLEKVRTANKAILRLEDLAVTAGEAGPCRVAVQHLDSEDRALALADRLRQRLPGVEVLVCDVGAVVGCHVGPGTVAVVVSPVPSP